MDYFFSSTRKFAENDPYSNSIKKELGVRRERDNIRFLESILSKEEKKTSF